MKKYKYSMTYEGPKTWHTCGPITQEHAKNQFKAFGVVYQCNGVWILDYKALNDERNNLPSVSKNIGKPSRDASAPTEPRQIGEGEVREATIGAERNAGQAASEAAK